MLSNIPLSLSNVLPEQSPTRRLRPLFTIGVHDVPFLMEDYEASKRRDQGEEAVDDEDDEAGSGWIACTTDSILAMKDTLWDMLITLPPEHSSQAKEKAWPVVECPRGTPVMATRRDLRRFNTLRSGLARLAASNSSSSILSTQRSDASRRSENTTTTASPSHLAPPAAQHADDSFDRVTEPLSWTALAYNGYMWWASAGEQLRSEEQEEFSRDAALLADLTPAPRTPSQAPYSTDSLAESLASLAARRSSSSAPTDDNEARLELAVIAYFHRLTTQILSILSDLVEAADEAYPAYTDDENEDDSAALLSEDDEEGRAMAAMGPPVTLDSRAMENMGLDVWSPADAAFVQDLLRIYFGRSAKIEGKGVEVCGVRVC